MPPVWPYSGPYQGGSRNDSSLALFWAYPGPGAPGGGPEMTPVLGIHIKVKLLYDKRGLGFRA